MMSPSRRFLFSKLHGNSIRKQNFVVNTRRLTTPRKILVVGSGAIGLRTSYELLQRSRKQGDNIQLIVKSSQHPLDPSVCSMGAGGLWMPFHVSDKLNRIDRWALDTFNELYPMAIDKDCDLAEIVPAISLFRDHTGHDALLEFDEDRQKADRQNSIVPPPWTRDSRIEFQHLTVEMLAWQNTVMKLKIPPEDELKQAGYLYAWLFKPPIVEPIKMLNYLLKKVSSDPQTLEMTFNQKYASMNEICHDAVQLGCSAVINCTGLGAGLLCNDDDVVGVRGILHHYSREFCPRRSSVMNCETYGHRNENDAVITTQDFPWGSETEPCYMIPRGEIIAIGGSCLSGDYEGTIRENERDRLLRNAHCLGIDLENSTSIGEWVGFRPYRESIRCEIDDILSTDSLRVVQNYGYGGSGWTLNVGAAKDVAEMVLEDRR